MPFLLLVSPDEKQRMLLNTAMTFAFLEKDGKVHAIAATGNVIEMPFPLEDIMSALEEAEDDDGDTTTN